MSQLLFPTNLTAATHSGCRFTGENLPSEDPNRFCPIRAQRSSIISPHLSPFQHSVKFPSLLGPHVPITHFDVALTDTARPVKSMSDSGGLHHKCSDLASSSKTRKSVRICQDGQCFSDFGGFLADSLWILVGFLLDSALYKSWLVPHLQDH